MNKEQKTISKGLAKKISEVAKEKGIELPESEWVWMKVYGNRGEFVLRIKDHGWNCYQEYFAYDCAELGEMLKDYGFRYYKDDKNYRNRVFYKTNVFYEADFWQTIISFSHESSERYITNDCDTEAEARGKMYLYLLENDLLK